MAVNPDFLRIYVPRVPMESTEWDCNFCLDELTSHFIDPCGHGNCQDCLDEITKDPIYDPPLHQPQRVNEHGHEITRAVLEIGGTKKCTQCSAAIDQVGQVFYSIKREPLGKMLDCGICHQPANLEEDEKGPPVISKRCGQPRDIFDQTKRVGHIFHEQCFQATLDRQAGQRNKTCVVCEPPILPYAPSPASEEVFHHFDEDLAPSHHFHHIENPPPGDSSFYFLNEISIAVSTVGYLILMVGFSIANPTTCFLGGGIMGLGLAGVAFDKGRYGATVCSLAASAVSAGLVLQVSTAALVSLSIVGAVALSAEAAYALT